MKYGCIGERLGHSFSKEIHNQIGDYQYELCEIKKEDLDSFMKKADFKAINVTIPYKESVIPYLNQISPIAKEIGAVNTIVNKNGVLYGYNTDFHGLKALIERADLQLTGKKVIILGTGGTSKTAVAVSSALGAEKILCVSRKKTDTAISYEDLYREHKDAQIIINCTPVGMYPNGDACPIDLEGFSQLEGVIDAIYNPLNTKLVRDARKKGIIAQCGLFMLVFQAIKASEFFLDTKYPPELYDKIYRKTLEEKENVVLTGMPACGKSSVGKLLSKKLNREFYDTDTLIEESLGCNIPELFKTKGEKFFRDAEARIIAEISNKNGVIIATGGGAVLREENVDNLKKNGILFFIDRSPEKLVPTSDRPLASTIEDITKRYTERYDTYCKTANVRIDADNADVQKAAEIIEKEFLNYENICY